MEANISKIVIILIVSGACNCIYRKTHPMRLLQGFPAPYQMPYDLKDVQKTAYVSYSNMCYLNYDKTVQDKPEILATIFNRAGLCRITNQENSSTMHYVEEVVHEYIYFVGNIGFFRPPSPENFDQPYRRVLYREKNVSTSIIVNGLNYDAQEQFIFYLAIQHHNHSYSKIYKVNVNSSENKESIFDQRQQEFIDLAYDWITKNMYVSGRTFVSVFNVNKTWSGREIASNLSNVQSLAVHPNKGYLFFVDTNNSSFSEESKVTHAIYRSNLDGSNIVKLSEDVNENLTSLGIDFYTDRLYWALPNSRIIRHAKLDGSDVKDILEKPVKESSHSISFDKKYVYYVQADKPWVRRFDKTDDKDDEDYILVSSQPMADIKVYDVESQKIRDDHPCLRNNGGCHHYCFAIPKDNDKLERSCSGNVNEEPSKSIP